MLLMCVYPTEQACPELFAILSASATVSFVSSNETERKSSIAYSVPKQRWKRRANESGRPVFVCQLSDVLLFCFGLALFKDAVSKEL